MTNPQAKKLAEQTKKIVDANKSLQTNAKQALRQVDKADASLGDLNSETK